MALARTERRAVVTNNLRDYRPLHADAITPGGPGHFGMIFMPSTYRRTRQDTGRIITALEAKLLNTPAMRIWPKASAGCNSELSTSTEFQPPPTWVCRLRSVPVPSPR
jgi:hypothetical protein